MAHRDWIVSNSENTDPKNVTDSIKTCNTLISQIISKQSRKATMNRRTNPSDSWMDDWNDDVPASSNNLVPATSVVFPRPAPKHYNSIEDVDLGQELATQLAEAMAHRDWLVANSENTDPKNVTDSIKTCNTLISQIISKQQTVVNMKRMLAVENAVIETMKEFPQAVKDKFFEILEQNLKEQSS